jgi:hypothetical protein
VHACLVLLSLVKGRKKTGISIIVLDSSGLSAIYSDG